MKITLNIPPDGLKKIKALGLRQRSPERLRWTADHPQSSYGIGVLLRGQSAELLDGASFRSLVDNFDAWIECDSERTRQRVDGALGPIERDENIIVVTNE
jgi:hypothetical protein